MAGERVREVLIVDIQHSFSQILRTFVCTFFPSFCFDDNLDLLLLIEFLAVILHPILPHLYLHLMEIVEHILRVLRL